MEATAMNESWKPTSNNHRGLNRSIPKAVSVKTWRVAGRSSLIEAIACILNMIVERTTEVESPVNMAKAQSVIMIMHMDIGLRYEECFHNGMRSRSINP